ACSDDPSEGLLQAAARPLAAESSSPERCSEIDPESYGKSRRGSTRREGPYEEPFRLRPGIHAIACRVKDRAGNLQDVMKRRQAHLAPTRRAIIYRQAVGDRQHRFGPPEHRTPKGSEHLSYHFAAADRHGAAKRIVDFRLGRYSQ